MNMNVREGTGNDDNWYALYTRHQHEKNVAWILGSKGFEVFLPLYTAVRHWQHRTATVSMPLFPSYVFLRGGLDRWLQIVTTPGLCSIVGSASGPAVIPRDDIYTVHRMVETSATLGPHPFLNCGDRVRVKFGPLEGLEGILVRKRNLFRLVISVEMLGRSAAVEIDADAVEPLALASATTGTGLVKNAPVCLQHAIIRI